MSMFVHRVRIFAESPFDGETHVVLEPPGQMSEFRSVVRPKGAIGVLDLAELASKALGPFGRLLRVRVRRAQAVTAAASVAVGVQPSAGTLVPGHGSLLPVEAAIWSDPMTLDLGDPGDPEPGWNLPDVLILDHAGSGLKTVDLMLAKVSAVEAALEFSRGVANGWP